MDILDDKSIAEAIRLPFLRCSLINVTGALMFLVPQKEEWETTLEKYQTWIMGEYVDSQILAYQKSGQLSDSEIESMSVGLGVISPITLAIYAQKLYAEKLEKTSDVQKERKMLARFPDRFKPRLKGNLSCRNGREPTAEEADLAKAKAEAANAPVPPNSLMTVIRAVVSPSPPLYVREYFAH